MKKQWKIFLIELLFFLSALFLGVLVSYEIESLFEMVEAEGFQNGRNSFSPIGFILYFIFATFVVFLISKSDKFKKSRVFLFRLAFIFSITIGGLVTLSIFVSDILALILVIILLLFWKNLPIILLHNLLIVLSVAGIGAMIGSMFEPFIIVILLALFSVYDFIAVYKTKHMVKMATEMIKTKAIMGLIIPFSFSGLLDNLNKKKKKEFMVLGGGDLAFPLFLVSSVTITYGLFEALILILFSSFGLFASFYLFISQKTTRPIPALPPIALFSIIGFIIILLI